MICDSRPNKSVVPVGRKEGREERRKEGREERVEIGKRRPGALGGRSCSVVDLGGGAHVCSLLLLPRGACAWPAYFCLCEPSFN